MSSGNAEADLSSWASSSDAPPVWVAFALGGVFLLISIGILVRRFHEGMDLIKDQSSSATGINNKTRLRILLSAYVDNDDEIFTITRMATQSFFFLGGFQLDYQLTWIVLICVFAMESFLDPLRVLLCMTDADSLGQIVIASPTIKGALRSTNLNQAQLTPKSIYEDLSREALIVFMYFALQATLIVFVFIDLYYNDTRTCFDGTPNCEITKTMGSWGAYILGIFMACVYLLGKGTSFGQSEQNPAFWLQLLFYTYHAKGHTCSWVNPRTGKEEKRILGHNDYHIWTRFIINILMNGVGFHILVHALPVQVASQSSLTGVVFRAVGMMYLVDLDDASGNVFTMEELVKIADDGANRSSNSKDDKTGEQQPLQSEDTLKDEAEGAAADEEATETV